MQSRDHAKAQCNEYRFALAFAPKSTASLFTYCLNHGLLKKEDGQTFYLTAQKLDG